MAHRVSATPAELGFRPGAAGQAGRRRRHSAHLPGRYTDTWREAGCAGL